MSAMPQAFTDYLGGPGRPWCGRSRSSSRMQGATRCFFVHFSLAYNNHGTVEKGYLQDDSFLYIAPVLAIVVTERMSFVRELFL